MTADECDGMVRGSIKASALPRMQANAVRSTRSLCCLTADAKGWYVSLSRTREAMHVYTRDKAALRQSVMHLGERKSVWELVQALGRLKPQSIDPIMPALCHGTPSGKGSRDWNGALRPLSANKLTFEGSHHFCYLSASPDQDNERSTAIINTWLSWKKQ